MLDLVVCTTVKDEREDYLREWIEWNFLLGVDFIYFFDNDSKIPLKNILSDIDNIAISETHGTCVRHRTNDLFILKFSEFIKWTAFIDVDEFIISKGNIKDHLNDKYAGLALSWRMFGDNDLEENVDCPQIEAFTKRALDSHEMNKYIKTIAQLKTVLHTIDCHHFAYKNNGFCVNEEGNVVQGSLSYPLYKSIYINHYYTRSKKDYRDKLARGHIFLSVPRLDRSGLERLVECNAVTDLCAIELKKTLLNKTYKKFYNEKVYLENNLDVKNAVSNGQFISGFEHFIRYGKNESRKYI